MTQSFLSISCFFVLFQGINYLHNEAPVKVIHRDLKSKNGKCDICFRIGSNCVIMITITIQRIVQNLRDDTSCKAICQVTSYKIN